MRQRQRDPYPQVLPSLLEGQGGAHWRFHPDVRERQGRTMRQTLPDPGGASGPRDRPMVPHPGGVHLHGHLRLPGRQRPLRQSRLRGADRLQRPGAARDAAGGDRRAGVPGSAARPRRRPPAWRGGAEPLRGVHPHQGRARALVRHDVGPHGDRRRRAGGSRHRRRHHRPQAGRGAAAGHRRGDLLDHGHRFPALPGPPSRERPRHGVRPGLRGGRRDRHPGPPAGPAGRSTTTARRSSTTLRGTPCEQVVGREISLPPLRRLAALPGGPLGGGDPHRELHRGAAVRPRPTGRSGTWR